jgi:acyl-coenzyme A synthetase/AMP-(fatty) acid ligase
VPAGYRDYLDAVRAHGDAVPPYTSVHGSDPASVDGTTFQEWRALAGALADRHGIRPGDRVLVDTAEHEQPVTWLLAPLAAGASIVLCANLDADAVDARSRREGVTRVL